MSATRGIAQCLLLHRGRKCKTRQLLFGTRVLRIILLSAGGSGPQLGCGVDGPIADRQHGGAKQSGWSGHLSKIKALKLMKIVQKGFLVFGNTTRPSQIQLTRCKSQVNTRSHYTTHMEIQQLCHRKNPAHSTAQRSIRWAITTY